MDKVRTGINGFDELVYGGIVRGNSVLIEGVPGAGKTTFGIEFVYRGITQFNEPGVIITCEELPESIYRDALNFGWNLQSLEKADKLRILCTSPEVLANAEINLVEEIVNEVGAKRIVFDSISHFRNIVDNPLALRKTVYSFCSGLRRLGLTSFLVKEREINRTLSRLAGLEYEEVLGRPLQDFLNGSRTGFSKLLQTLSTGKEFQDLKP
ncbi:RAD55 family ATPase [Desulfoscipio geothermicus]|uniref:KaiC protein n=1 Tax=Desulfoscipio geothermicus DSM 3669 TaxID=1121426 RepID=A0A1I6D564_9FIRM|nr:ATPase domain-containing protein [Desulfoscipio geothermicus]SFR00543.1 KaiC protein [Desulfoscipio geothermicus DSM 3669]